MFDTPTAELIAAAPALDGLDLSNLPKELTRAYSTIVSLRMRLRGSNVSEAPTEELRSILERLERLGFAQEAFAAVAPDRENRAAAAFVAASAHQLRFAAERLQSPVRVRSQLTVDAIGPEIAATVMFLIADRVADAAQMSRSIHIEGSSTVEDQLRQTIADLARGNLTAITSSTWTPSATSENDSDVDAVALLWWRLLQGIRFTMHGRCVREGFDRVEKLALHQLGNGLIPRVPICQQWEQLKAKMQAASEYEAFPDMVRRVRLATRL